MKTVLLSIISFVIFFSAPIATLAQAKPQAAVNERGLKVRIVTKGGKVMSFDWPVRVESRWVKVAEKTTAAGPAEIPQVSVYFEVPGGHHISPVSGLEKRFPQLVGPGKMPGSKAYLAQETRNSFIYTVEYSEKGSTRTERAVLVLVSREEEPAILVHPACDKEGFAIQPRMPLSGTQYAAIFCTSQANTVDWYTITSPDVTISGQSPADVVARGAGWAHYRLSKPGAGWLARNDLGTFSALENEFKTQKPFTLTYVTNAAEPPRTETAPRKLHLMPGIALSYANYVEAPNKADVKAFYIRPDVTASYAIKPTLAIEAMANLSPWPIKNSGSSAKASYWTTTASLAIGLPWKARGVSFFLVPGLGSQGMWVQNNVYGIGGLAGPHLGIRAKTENVSFDLRYSPISRQGLLAVDGHELTGRAAYTIPKKPNALSIFSEATTTTIKAGSLPKNTVKSFSGALGLSIDFPGPI